MDCPICFEKITDVNCVTTECGHHFHTSCLMKNTAINGYGCPYCRTVMAEEQIDNDDDDDSSYGFNNYDDDDSYYKEEEEEYTYESFRWFHQRLNDEVLEGDEEEYQIMIAEEKAGEEEEKVIFEENKEQVKDVINEMKKINNLSYDELLTAFLYKNHHCFRHNAYGRDIFHKVSSTTNDVGSRILINENVTALL